MTGVSHPIVVHVFHVWCGEGCLIACCGDRLAAYYMSTLLCTDGKLLTNMTMHTGSCLQQLDTSSTQYAGILGASPMTCRKAGQFGDTTAGGTPAP
jgi:hypothetical protein